MTVRAFFAIVTVVLLVVGLIVDNEKQQKVILALTAVSVLAVVIPLDELIHIPPEPSELPITPTQTAPTLVKDLSPSPMPERGSPYGQALLREQLESVTYTDEQKINIITETYKTRKTDSGAHKNWYTSTRYTDDNTGYQIGLYYADGILFFADAYHVGEPSSVTFYFWNDQMIACHDIVGGENGLSYAGSGVYNRIVSAYGNIYEKSLQYAKDAK